MDIQVASNFERFLYYAEGCDPKKVREIVQIFKETGKYVFKNFDSAGFTSSRSEDAQLKQVINEV